MNIAELPSSDNSFTSSVMSNRSSFNPGPPAKEPKPPKAPDKPLVPYMRYSREIWDSVKAAHQDQKLSEIGRIIGRMWRELPLHEKQKYIDDYDVDKVKYAETFKTYQSSPAYQQFLLAREKFFADEREAKAKVRVKPEPRITLPACEADEVSVNDLDAFHHRQVAASRYHRNQRLLQEVFNDVCVPDMRQIITIPRLMSLKRQVETLTLHHKKIDTETSQLVENFERKKRRLEDGSREFHGALAKYQEPAITPTSYGKMVEEAERQLLGRYRAYLEKQMGPSAATVSSDPSTHQPTSNDQGSNIVSGGQKEERQRKGEGGEGKEEAQGNAETEAKKEPMVLVDEKSGKQRDGADPNQQNGPLNGEETGENGKVNGIIDNDSNKQ